jgi:phospholipid/cholesterol/gamma-HCH transport system permease protein
MDTTGAATLFEILNYAYEHSVRLRLVGVTGQPRRLAEIAQLDQIFAARIGGGVSLSLLEHIGRPLLGWAQDVGALTLQCWTAIRGLPNAMPVVGKRRRWRAVLEQALAIGVRALPMASVMSLSLGFVLALQSAAELRRFGGINFVVDLVAVASTRELGALITAIAVSGRSASAISAEVGTMVVTEEMDALRVMGLNPAEFTLAPKYLGALVAMPCLTKQ